MPQSGNFDAMVARLTGELVALRVMVRRLIAHLAATGGDGLRFLEDELARMREELPQYAAEELSDEQRLLMYARAREVIEEAYTTIAVGRYTLANAPPAPSDEPE